MHLGPPSGQLRAAERQEPAIAFLGRPPSLVYSGERSHVVDYLRAKGWDVEGTVRTDLFRRNGLPVPAPHDDDPLGEIIFISGRLNG